MRKQIEVTRAAIINRLRRRLARDGFVLRLNRPRTHAYRQIGECSIIDPNRKALVEGSSVAEFAQQYELLASWERISPQPPRHIRGEVRR